MTVSGEVRLKVAPAGLLNVKKTSAESAAKPNNTGKLKRQAPSAAMAKPAAACGLLISAACRRRRRRLPPVVAAVGLRASAAPVLSTARPLRARTLDSVGSRVNRLRDRVI